MEWVTREGELSIEQLTKRFGVTGMTIRRDLQSLEEAGRLIRTHGGVMPADRVSFEFKFLQKSREHAAEKSQIALQAGRLIEAGQTIMLDSGSTTLAIARVVRGVQPLTIVTSSLPIASEFFGAPGTEVILLGGSLRKDSPDLMGPVAEAALDMLRADVAFIGAEAIDEQGNLYTQQAEMGRLLSSMARACRKVYAVADSSKIGIGQQRLIRFARLRDWEGLITDEQLDLKVKRDLTRLNIRIFQP